MTEKEQQYGIRKHGFRLFVSTDTYFLLKQKRNVMKKYIHIYNNCIYLVPKEEQDDFISSYGDEDAMMKWAHNINDPVYTGSRETIDSLFDLDSIKAEAEKAKAVIQETNDYLSIRDIRKWAVEQVIKSWANSGGAYARVITEESERLIKYIQNGNGETTS